LDIGTALLEQCLPGNKNLQDKETGLAILLVHHYYCNSSFADKSNSWWKHCYSGSNH